MASIQKYDTKKGTFYRAIVYAGIDPNTGKQVNVQKRGFKTQKAANRWADKTRVEIARGTREARPTMVTFAAVYTEWVDLYKPTVKSSTYLKTRELFKLHILPRFGDQYINKITPVQCQQAVNDWYKTHSHYKVMYQYTKRVLDHAIKKGQLQRNPCADLTIPKQRKAVKDNNAPYWDKEELNRFLAACKADNRVMIYPFFRLLAYTGMRRGEILALRWIDLDLDNSRLYVRQALTRNAEGQIIPDTPKNTTSERTIALDATTVEVLKDWQHYQASDHYVFESKNRTLLSDSRPRQWLNQVCTTIDLQPITLHGLRHTHCTLLFEAGMTVKEVQDRLGHASAEMTLNVYTHLTNQRRTDLPDRFADFMQL